MVDFDGLVLGPITQAFGQAITYIDAFQRRTQLLGVFDQNFLEQQLQGDGFVATQKPMLGCRVSDLPTVPVENELFRIPGDSVLPSGPYWVVQGEPRADSHGWLHIQLIRKST